MAYSQSDLDNLNQRIDELMAAKADMEVAIRYGDDFTVAGRDRAETRADDHLTREAAIPRASR